MSNESDHGTTTVGIVADDSVVLAADTQVSRGLMNAYKRDSVKINKIHPRAMMTTAGSVSSSQSLKDSVRREVRMYESRRERDMDIQALAGLMGRLMKDSSYRVSPIMGGYDSKPRLYALDSLGSLSEFDSFVATGSGTRVAQGHLQSRYDGDLSTEEAESIAQEAIEICIERDHFTGHGVTLGVVDADSLNITTYELKSGVER